MKTTISISDISSTSKLLVYMVFLVLLFSITSQTVFAVTNPPVAKFDHDQITSLKTNPTLSGSVSSLILPLHIEITASSSDESVLFSKDISVYSGQWSTVVYPPLSIGMYQVTLSSGKKILARRPLAIGVTAPKIELEKILPYDVADGHLIRFSIHANKATGIAQLGFKIVPTNATIATLSLTGFTDENYSQPIATGTDGTLVTTLFDATSSIALLTPDMPIEIPAGKTYHFSLDAEVTPTDYAYDITTTLLSDSPDYMGKNVSNLAKTSNFIWSQNSFDITSSTEEDWVNGWSLTDLLFGLTSERYATPTLSCDLEADNNEVTVGTPVQLTWSSSGGDKITWEDGTVSSLNGSKTVIASTTHTYVINLSGSLGPMQCFTTVTADPIAPIVLPPTPTPTPTPTPAPATTTPIGNFTATPTTGTATLVVSFKGSVNIDKSCKASIYTFGYGDNSTSTIAVPLNTCKAVAFTLSHSYTTVGTRTAQLYFGTFAKGTTTPLIQSQKITINKKVVQGNSIFANVIFAINDTERSMWAWFKNLGRR